MRSPRPTAATPPRQNVQPSPESLPKCSLLLTLVPRSYRTLRPRFRAASVYGSISNRTVRRRPRIRHISPWRDKRGPLVSSPLQSRPLTKRDLGDRGSHLIGRAGYRL